MENLKGRDHLKYLNVDLEKILRWVLNKQLDGRGLDLFPFWGHGRALVNM